MAMPRANIARLFIIPPLDFLLTEPAKLRGLLKRDAPASPGVSHAEVEVSHNRCSMS
jgi:hypothetical protein